jgi:L-ascorbate metabolism protein UlaG (beta-lactamase superfamily)
MTRKLREHRAPWECAYAKESKSKCKPGKKPKSEIIFVSICGTVVINSKEAAKFSQEINPKLTIPIHYDSPNYPVDVNKFVKEMNSYNVRVLKKWRKY